jgi:hypothetical protein
MLRYYDAENVHLKTKLFKLKNPPNKRYFSFYKDKDLKKENLLFLNDKDFFLCIDEFEQETTKEFKQYFHFEKIIKILYNTSILYLPIKIVFDKKTKSFFLYDFTLL